MDDLNLERDALLSLYSIERDDERSMNSVYATLLAAALAVIGVVSVAFVAGNVSRWMYAGIPILPLPLFCATSLYMMTGGIRHRLMEGMERRLAELLDIKIDPSFDATSGPNLKVPLHVRLGERVIRWRKPDPYSILGIVGSAGCALSLLAIYIFLIAESVAHAGRTHYGKPPGFAEPLGYLIGTICGVAAIMLTLAAIDSWREKSTLVGIALKRMVEERTQTEARAKAEAAARAKAEAEAEAGAETQAHPGEGSAG